MKFLARLLILISILYSVSNAQLISYYGIKIGMVSSKLKMDYQGNSTNFNSVFDKNRLGPTMGLFIRYFEMSNFDLETELCYVQKGGTDKFDITTINNPKGTGEYILLDIQFDFIQLRTALRPNYSINNIEIYGLAGLSIDYLLSVKNGILPRDKYSDFVWAYTLGFGLAYSKIFNHNISLEFAYDSDINEIYKNENDQYTNSLFLLKAGISLNKDN